MSEAMAKGPAERWKPYPKYKDSGVEWLGEVPEHWETLPLKRRFDVRLGKMLQSEPKEQTDVLRAYIRAANLSWDGVDFSDVKEMWFSPRELSLFSVCRGDLLISEGGDVGRATLWTSDVEMYIQNAINRVRSLGVDSTRFLFYWAYMLKHNGYIDLICNKATIAHYTAEKVEATPVALPTREEQNAIAAFLDRETAKVDALIAKKEKLIELLQEKRTALITRAVTKGLPSTGSGQAPGSGQAASKVTMKDSGVEWLGEIPAHWEVRRISASVDKITNGYVGPTRDILVNDGVRYLQSLHIKDGSIDFERRPYYVTAEWSRENSKSILRTGDILIVQTGDIGQVCAVNQEYDGCNCHALIILRLKPGLGCGFYISRLFQSTYGQNTLKWSQTGALHPHLECGHVKGIRILLPPAKEQDLIKRFLDEGICEIDLLIAKVREAIERLKEYRTALISAAVTGKIDVRVTT